MNAIDSAKKAFLECRRVLNAGGQLAFLVSGSREQPFLPATIHHVLKSVEAPKPDPDAPDTFLFHERGLLQRRLKDAEFSEPHEEARTVPGRWAGSLEESWQQFIDVAAPFRPLIARLTPEARAKLEEEVFADRQNFSDGKTLTLQLEIVIGDGTKP